MGGRLRLKHYAVTKCVRVGQERGSRRHVGHYTTRRCPGCARA